MSTVSYALTGSTAVVTLDDGKANALSPAAVESLLSAVDRAEAEAAALVLTGRPDRFCAGFDLRAMMAGPDQATALLRRGSELFLRLYASPLPVVMACTGHAMAGGALLLLCGDVRIGVGGPFKLGLNEVSIGMPLPILGAELARDRLAVTELTAATIGARIYDPPGARAAGFLDEVVAADQVLPRAMAEALRLGTLPRAAHAATKLRIRGRTVTHVRDTLEADMADAMRVLGAAARPS
ncbi:MAG: crotonase/enoyl-CoA hydratase family protein [Myxococcota bacterium]